MFENIGEIVVLFWRTLLALPVAWRQRQKVYDQFFEIGNASLFMVCILSFFIGGVMALQTGPVSSDPAGAAYPPQTQPTTGIICEPGTPSDGTDD